jgi:cytochrome c oxidase cbb3-type subunit III
MSPFWSGWIIFLIVLNLGIALFLFVFSQRAEIPTRPDGTTGHAWAHGVLKEGVHRLPKWWVLISAASLVIAAVYLALYPGFGGFRGLLGWTSVGEYRQDVAENTARLESVFASLDSRDIDQFASGHPIMTVGRQLYLDNCAACHGTDARGHTLLGAPNLVDSVWMYGGEPPDVIASILDGRRGMMPPWGEALGRDGVMQVTAYVRSLSGLEAKSDWTQAGKTHYVTACAGCHGIDGKGMQALGAPDLTDDDWLYGGGLADVVTSIRDGRSGEMPGWRGRLTEAEARAIAAWLYTSGERGARTRPHR